MTIFGRTKSANKANDASNLRRNADIGRTKSPAAFSYYSGRATGKAESRTSNIDNPRVQKTKATNNPGKLARFTLKPTKSVFRASIMPTYLTIVLLVIAFGYSLMLSSDPRVVIKRSSDNLMVHADADYESAVDVAWNNSLLSKSKLTIRTKSIEDEITRQFGDIEDVKVSLPLLGRQAEVLIIAKSPAIIVKSSSSESYFLDKNGYVLGSVEKSIEAASLQSLPVVSDESGFDIEQGARVMSSQQVGFVRKLSAGFNQKNMTATSYSLPRSAIDQLDVKFADKQYFVKFAMSGEAEQAIGALAVINAQIGQGAVGAPGEYIDVRIPGKVFIK
jgi:hypothetical protein